MIKFFRNIRKTLLAEGLPTGQEGKTMGYLKYAIGEIVLVVVGILIALQLNNWKEYTADRTSEPNQLKNIQDDIPRDTTEISFNIAHHSLFLNSQKNLLAYTQCPNIKPAEGISCEWALGIPLVLTLENDLDEYKTYMTKLPYFPKYFLLANKVAIQDNTRYNSIDYFGPGIEFNKLILADTVAIKNNEVFKIVLAQSIRFTKIKIQVYLDFLEHLRKLKKAIDQEPQSV